MCEVQNYVYTLSDEGVWCNLYGGSELDTEWMGNHIQLLQETDYPWDGAVSITLKEVPEKKSLSLFLRVPEWCTKATLAVNDVPVTTDLKAGTYAEIKRIWKKGDRVAFVMGMEPVLLESHPLVEETRNQVAVKRGPVVYCLESMDVEAGKRIDDILIPADIKFSPVKTEIAGSRVTVLDGIAHSVDSDSWEGKLYRKVAENGDRIPIRLIPYYAWGNRGESEMTVWMLLER